MYYLYFARCQDNSLYIGCTSVVPRQRMERHNNGTGAKWFLKHGQGFIVYTESYSTLIDARRRERQIKKWSRIKKRESNTRTQTIILEAWQTRPTVPTFEADEGGHTQ
ncbi:GIY-YIG nuclease family protein [Patescibacteria group bacterium]|nr:GIY-YIG nuclease family protein [Patescibacteria group bacterium]MBU1890533.1 GIY-YIG nuclease family protein [Patescibacteria group bacterium]